MKELLGSVSSATKKTAAAGLALVALMVAASAVLHFGAGSLFDYFRATIASEALLSFSRPAGVAVCLSVYLIEHGKRRRNDY